MARRPLGLLAAVCLVAACSDPPRPAGPDLAIVRGAGDEAPARSAPQTGPARSFTAAGGAAGYQPPPLFEPEFSVGNLELSIVWPEEATASFQTQVIPFSANAVIISVYASGAGNPIIPRVTAVRPDSGGIGVATLTNIPAANNYRVDIEAYRERSPVPGTSTIVANGAQPGVNILPSAITPVTIRLFSTFEPLVTAVEPGNVVVPGQRLVFRGNNLGANDAQPKVTFTGTGASVSVAALPIEGGAAWEVTQVPAGVACGPVLVENDNVPAANMPVIWVPRQLAIDAPAQSWSGRPLGRGQVYFGRSLTFSSTHSWEVNGAPGTRAEQYGVPPQPEFSSAAPRTDSVSGAPVNAIDRITGRFDAYAPHVGDPRQATTSITASLGAMVSNAIVADPVGVYRVAPNPFSPIPLNARPATGSPDPAFLLEAGKAVEATLSIDVVSTLPFDPTGLVWGVTRAGMVSPTVTAPAVKRPPFDFSYATRVESLPGGATGSLFVTCAASDDAAVAATLSVTVDEQGGFQVEVE